MNDTNEQFSPGIKIILERIREFPEDFVNARSGNLYTERLSWENLVGEVMREGDTFTKEEQKALRDALRGARRAQFDAKVLDLLAKKPKDMMEEWNEAYGAVIQSGIATGTGMSQVPKRILMSRAEMEIAKRIAEGNKF